MALLKLSFNASSFTRKHLKGAGTVSSEKTLACTTSSHLLHLAEQESCFFLSSNEALVLKLLVWSFLPLWLFLSLFLGDEKLCLWLQNRTTVGCLCAFVDFGGCIFTLCVCVCLCVPLHLCLVVKSQEIEVVRGWEMGSRPGLITSHWYSKHHSSWKLVLSPSLSLFLFFVAPVYKEIWNTMNRKKNNFLIYSCICTLI